MHARVLHFFPKRPASLCELLRSGQRNLPPTYRTISSLCLYTWRATGVTSGCKSRRRRHNDMTANSLPFGKQTSRDADSTRKRQESLNFRRHHRICKTTTCFLSIDRLTYIFLFLAGTFRYATTDAPDNVKARVRIQSGSRITAPRQKSQEPQ